ncbi:MAG: acylneuraminate cytidylyltransferase [Nitrospiraceae bacterium]|jgi:N-acylneuraminate cytidylyltransferase|nr:acylneuraminate cytidylyltransferase [Nitrospiraceae bacterium]|tara:strand:- start:2194 stop:2961 length:768 start_codon:yes stop_codon:yes gene_type:complete
MNASEGLLAIIPARGGSKGLPGKNIRPFIGLPLIAHSILLAQACAEVERIVVSTDAPEIADVARKFGAEVPFMRPAELAQDETPLWPVLRHTLEEIESRDGRQFEFVLLLDPTTPCRLPIDVVQAFHRLRAKSSADGIIGISEPDFSPIWHSVIERDGWMTDLISEGSNYHRRQDVPVVYRVNGTLYIWRTEFMRREKFEWRKRGKHLMYEVADFSAISVDTREEFERAELFVKAGMVRLPWLSEHEIPGQVHPN